VSENPANKGEHSILAGISALGLLLNLGLLLFYYFPAPKQLISDEDYYYTYALTVAAGQRTAFDLIRPPLYGELIGGLFSIFGPHVIVVQAIQIGCWLTTGILFCCIVQLTTASVPVSHIALGLYLASPELSAFAHYLWPETIHLFLWMLALWLLISGPQSWRSTALAGIALGLALLTKSLLLPFLSVIVLFVVVSSRPASSVIRRLVPAAVLLGTLFITVLPVMLYNLTTQGEFMIADSSALNLWVGLNDRSPADSSDNEIVGTELREYIASGPDHSTRNAIYAEKILALIRQRGIRRSFLNQVEKQYFRLFDLRTFFSTQLQGGGRESYPARSAGLTAFLRLASYAIYGFILTAGAIGACFVRLRRLAWSQLFLLFIAYNLSLFFFLHAVTRYVIQFLPLLILFASAVTYWLMSVLSGRKVLPGGFVFNRLRGVMGFLAGAIMVAVMLHGLI